MARLRRLTDKVYNNRRSPARASFVRARLENLEIIFLGIQALDYRGYLANSLSACSKMCDGSQ